MSRSLGIMFLAAVMASGAAAAADESLSLTGKLPPTKVVPYKWGKDPFSPGVRSAAFPEMRLTAVFYGAERPSAIINDRIVYRGNVVNGQKVIDIGRTHVILHGESGDIRLEITGVPELPHGGK